MAERNETAAQDETRKEAIVEAAARIFAEKGFAGASNREIAREAGISPGLIYWYFRDKDELFMAVLRRLFPLRILEVPEESPRDLPLEDLLRSIGTQFMQIMSHSDVLRLIRLALAEILRFPDLRRQLGQMIASQALDRLAQQLDVRIEQGEIPPIDTHLAAQAFFGSLVSFILRKYIFQSDDLTDTPDDAMIEITVRIHAAGLRAGSAGGS
jgi:AcrR family transcriptional regulator